jgi:hypothetical protein
MEYKRTLVEHYPFDFPSPLEKHELTIIWGDDGWRYIPFLKLRDRFTQGKYYMQRWEGVLAMPRHIENDVTWTLYSHQPRMWRETTKWKDEIYEAKTPNQTE